MNTVIFIIAAIIIISMVVLGLYLRSENTKISDSKARNIFKGSLVTSLVVVAALVTGVLATPDRLHAQEKHQTNSQEAQIHQPQEGSVGLGYIAAAIAVGLGSLGAAIAVGMSAAAAVGAVSENRKVFGNAIVFVGLAEGIAIYGLIIAIMILNKL